MEKTAKTAKKYDVDMTEGNIFLHLFRFSLPLLAGNLFQQFYNMTDTWIVGNYVGDVAFSAVGSVAMLLNMFTGTFAGLAGGVSVVIAQYYGAKEKKKVKNSVYTAVILTAGLSMVMTILGIAVTPAMLKFLKISSKVFVEAQTYLKIYLGGITGVLFYNMGAGILRAMGDSKRPFYYLIISVFLNIALDLIFVIVWKAGVAGVALATVISQMTAAVLSMKALEVKKLAVLEEGERRKVHMGILKKMLKNGMPAAVQMSLTCFTNLFVQAEINRFGLYCMGGWAAFSRIDQLNLLPMQSLSTAGMTFVGQNLGKRYEQRAKRGVRIALMMSVAVTSFSTVSILLCAGPLIEFFNSNPEIVRYGTKFICYIVPLHVVSCFSQVYAGALRGAGSSRTPMAVFIISFAVIRQGYLWIVRYFMDGAIPVAMSYPFGWGICAILMSVCYHRNGMKCDKIFEEN